jgi:hypothetical protein
MKTIITAIAAGLFAANVSALDIYHGFADGNPDLQPIYTDGDSSVSAVQPGIGDSVDLYHNFDDGNQDLFSGVNDGSTAKFDSAAVYHGFSGNPDL